LLQEWASGGWPIFFEQNGFDFMQANDSMTFDSTLWQEGRKALALAVKLYLHDPNVTHIDLGCRVRSAQGYRLEPELVVRVHVRQKLYGENFHALLMDAPERVIAAERIGFPVDVLPARYRLHRAEPRGTATALVPAHHELRGGLPIATASGTSHATLGGKVRDRRTGEEMVLSSWHALSSPWQSHGSALMCRPRDGDGGEATIATYTRGAMPAYLDAAVARLSGRRPFINEQCGIGAVTGVTAPRLGMRVVKSGGGTGVTTGIITGVEGFALQRYAGIQRVLHHVVHIMPAEAGAPLCAGGDSGAWWLEAVTLRAVGLHFAGSAAPDFGLAHAMPEVLEALEVEIEESQTPIQQKVFAVAVESTKICEQEPLLPSKKSSSLQELRGKLSGKMKELAHALSQVKRPRRESCAAPKPDTLAAPPAANRRAFLRKLWSDLRFNRLPMLRARCWEICARVTRAAMGALKPANCLALLRKLLRNWRIMSAPAGVAAVMSLMGARLDERLSAKHEDELQRVLELQPSLSVLRATAQVDSARRITLDKIIAIIDQRNPKMPPDLKLKIADEIYLMSLKYSNLDVELICATITHETGHTWNPRSISKVGARGLMQIMPATGRMLAEAEGLEWNSPEETLFDPILNIRLGCRYLSGLVLAYSVDGGLAAYNGGERRAERWLKEGRREDVLALETRAYVPAILKIYDRFRQ
jgi:soluble lytic murein transglycosylase-like protein